MHISNASPGMILAQDIFDESGTLLLEKGIQLTTRYLKRLERLRISSLRVYDPIAEKLKERSAISAELRGEIELCFQSLYQLQTSRLPNPKLSTSYLKQLETLVGAAIEESKRQLPDILHIQIRQPEENEMTHAINVCLLSLITGLTLGLSRPALEELGIGALLHDIGKAVQLSSPPHNDIPDLHPLYGRNLLTLLARNVTACRIAAEHHEHYDGSGFPLGRAREQLHPHAQIVAIANHFDNALRASLLSGTPRQEILEEMMSKGNTLFDLRLLTTFLHAVPLFSVGNFVRLNTGETGYVTANHAHFPLRPQLHLPNPAGGRSIDLMQTSTLTICEVIEE